MKRYLYHATSMGAYRSMIKKGRIGLTSQDFEAVAKNVASALHAPWDATRAAIERVLKHERGGAFSPWDPGVSFFPDEAAAIAIAKRSANRGGEQWGGFIRAVAKIAARVTKRSVASADVKTAVAHLLSKYASTSTTPVVLKFDTARISAPLFGSGSTEHYTLKPISVDSVVGVRKIGATMKKPVKKRNPKPSKASSPLSKARADYLRTVAAFIARYPGQKSNLPSYVTFSKVAKLGETRWAVDGHPVGTRVLFEPHDRRGEVRVWVPGMDPSDTLAAPRSFVRLASGRKSNPSFGDYFSAGKRAAAGVASSIADQAKQAAAQVKQAAESEASRVRVAPMTEEQAIRLLAKSHGLTISNPKGAKASPHGFYPTREALVEARAEKWRKADAAKAAMLDGTAVYSLSKHSDGYTYLKLNGYGYVARLQEGRDGIKLDTQNTGYEVPKAILVEAAERLLGKKVNPKKRVKKATKRKPANRSTRTKGAR